MKSSLYTEFSQLNEKSLKTRLETSDSGLAKSQVDLKLAKYGHNVIKNRAKTWLSIFARQFRSSFTYLLIAAGLIALFLGEYIDAVMVFIFLSINVFLGFLQEFKSEKAADLLKKYISVRARVRREGKEIIISGEELVPGDLVIVEAGDIIPADIRFLSENNLTVDESPLTGESVPIKKTSQPLKNKNIEMHEAFNIGFSATRVVEGKGEGIVFATGRSTTIGDIARLTEETKRVSNFEKGLDKFSKFILLMVLVTLSFVMVANIVVKGGQLDMLELLLFSIALAISVIPEALQVVTSVSLSQGALRLAKLNVVVRRLTAIEDLGSVEVLCTDKTGTLTENRLSVAEVYSKNESECLHYAALANSFLNDKKQEPNNAFDIAIWNSIKDKEKKIVEGFIRGSEIPFTPERRRSSIVVTRAEKSEMVVRGAPEMVLPLIKNMSSSRMETLMQWVSDEGTGGKRVLAIGRKKIAEDLEKYDEKSENGLDFLGLISFIDPIKSTTEHAVREAKSLGVNVKILTGDGKEVAQAVGRSIGLVKQEDQVITGAELERLDPESRLKMVDYATVFARVSPQQKYDIIRLLQVKHSVGFLGEGINDAPALQTANVSLVVDSASDIAREASDIILLKQSLDVIVSGIKQGRVTYSNTVKYIKATLTSNFGNFYAIAAATLLIDFLPMLPLQILLVNLLSDFPMIAIATDRVDPQELKRPKSYDVKNIVLLATLLGLVSTTFDFLFFGLFYKISPEVLHTNWYIGSILTELILVFSIRTRLPFWKATAPSKLLALLTICIFIITVSLPFTLIGQNIFSFIRPTTADLTLIFSIVACYFIVTETVKLSYYHFIGNKSQHPV